MSILRSRFRDERGFNLIELMIVIAIIGLLIGVGSYAWQSMMKSGNETAAAQTMDKIRVYENQYAAKNRGKFANFDELIKNVGLDERFAGDHPVVNGYTYTLTITEASGNQPAKFAVNADPQGEGISATGNRHFYTDSTLSTIKFSDTAPASAADPSI
jgi:prepilin-type N-terminal cleavage/methylation domain-containing protein